MVDTLRDIGPGTIVCLPATQFKVYKVDTKACRRTYFKICYNTGQVQITDYRLTTTPHTVIAYFEADTMGVKSVPTTHTGSARSRDTTWRVMSIFRSGDQALYQEWLRKNRTSEWHNGHWDMADATVSHDPDAPKRLVDTKRYKKMDLICAVIMAHGPSTRDDILRRVAILEGKPWVQGSNTDYFRSKDSAGIIEKRGKSGMKDTWYVTQSGVIRGSQVLANVGIDLVKDLP